MRVETIGADSRTESPSVAVVAGIHGDEPCGVHAVEELLADPPAVSRPVRIVIANERAVERGVRYVDEDLNRSFPGDPNAETHEGRLAARLSAELAGCTTLALHSTRSHPEPFAVVDERTPLADRLVPRLPVVSLVETGTRVEGRIFASVPRTIEVECGRQETPDAAENAEELVEAFLAATGVTDESPVGDGDRTDGEPLPVFRLRERIPKPPASEYAVTGRNFERVERGEAFARADDEMLSADEPFYPVLLSADGYENAFGYVADRVGTL